MSSSHFFVAQGQMISNEVLDLLKETAFIMPNWKWIVLVGMIATGLLTRPLVQYLIRLIKQKNSIVQEKALEKSVFWRSFISLEIEGPLSWILLALTWRFLVDTINFTDGIDKHADNLAKLILSFYLIKLTYKAADAFGKVLESWAAKTENPIDDQLAPFATKSLKVLVVVMGVLLTLQNFKFEVMSLLAGLGLGGLALALAAQDTAANLFGSITILLDHPFKIGDWVKIGDTEGNVEEIGFRSTRIRTFYNSVISIPNSVVAKEKIDNMGERALRRVRTNLGLHYDTPPETIKAFCERLKTEITQHPAVQAESVSVFFNAYLDSSLNILVNFHIKADSNLAELTIQQDLYCRFLDIAKEMKVVYAYPTRTLYIQQ